MSRLETQTPAAQIEINRAADLCIGLAGSQNSKYRSGDAEKIKRLTRENADVRKRLDHMEQLDSCESH